MKKTGEIPIGSFRIGKDLQSYEKTKTGWRKSSIVFSDALKVIHLFKLHGRFSELIDKKDPKYLKGYIHKDEIKGARINILPNGEKLDKAYSLFAKDLTIHDQDSHDHWDAIYRNPNGQFAYVYTLKKIKASKKEKYKKVHEFEGVFDKLSKNTLNALKREDPMALSMCTLLNTYIRIGNEVYYKLHNHKGLTTLMKKDIKIKKNRVSFQYLGKDGVPISMEKEFPAIYISQLKKTLSARSSNEFIFTNAAGNPLKEIDFKRAFKRYCGKEFYPHIVRSYIATQKAKEFLNANKNPTKEEVKSLFTSIASELGHKKFDKKTSEWKDSYNVTIHHYIQPDLVEKIQKLADNS